LNSGGPELARRDGLWAAAQLTKLHQAVIDGGDPGFTLATLGPRLPATLGPRLPAALGPRLPAALGPRLPATLGPRLLFQAGELGRARDLYEVAVDLLLQSSVVAIDLVLESSEPARAAQSCSVALECNKPNFAPAAAARVLLLLQFLPSQPANRVLLLLPYLVGQSGP
jgi:hypothetical protein